jgi:hypothetical protein
MVCFQIIHLFSEQDRPQILAEELDDIQIIGEAGTVSGKPARAVLLKTYCDIE